MQERGYFYTHSRANDGELPQKVGLNHVKTLAPRIDAAVVLVDAVLQEDLDTASYLDRKKDLIHHKGETVGSEAFRLDYDPAVSAEALYEDVVSYLGEYRFEVPEYRYKQRFTRTVDDPSLRLRGEKDDTSMITYGDKAIKKKIEEGEDVGKVKADLAGMKKVESLLKTAKTGDRILYASPPDEEYGYDYGFFYDGRVEEIEGGEKILHVRALRIEPESNLEEFNKALTEITGSETSHVTPNQFIENPELITQPISDMEINKILQSVFHFESDAKRLDKFKSSIQQMMPYIDGFIVLIKNDAPLAQRQQALHALENLALSLKEDAANGEDEVVLYDRSISTPSNLTFNNFVDKFGYKPPDVQGTCGNSGGRSSNNIFGAGSIFTGAAKGGSNQEWFTCPECSFKANGPIGNKCPGCGLTKESHAAKSGVMCD